MAFRVLINLAPTMQFLNLLKRIAIGAGNQDIMLIGQHSFDDGNDLRDGLAATKDDFRKALPDRTMVVDSGKAEVFERQVF